MSLNVQTIEPYSAVQSSPLRPKCRSDGAQYIIVLVRHLSQKREQSEILYRGFMLEKRRMLWGVRLR